MAAERQRKDAAIARKTTLEEQVAVLDREHDGLLERLATRQTALDSMRETAAFDVTRRADLPAVHAAVAATEREIADNRAMVAAIRARIDAEAREIDAAELSLRRLYLNQLDERAADERAAVDAACRTLEETWDKLMETSQEIQRFGGTPDEPFRVVLFGGASVYQLAAQTLWHQRPKQ